MIHTNIAGYSLITVLVYSALLSGIAVLIMPYALRIHTSIKHQQESTRLLVQRTIALDSLVYDIQTASGLYNDWHITPCSQLIMRKQDQHISWIIEDEQLVRIEGIYDTSSKIWQTHTKSLITTGVSQIQITLHKNNRVPNYVSAVTVQLADKGGTFQTTRSIVLPNRILS